MLHYFILADIQLFSLSIWRRCFQQLLIKDYSFKSGSKGLWATVPTISCAALNQFIVGGTAGSIASRWGIFLIALNFHITLSHRLQPRTVLHNDVTFIFLHLLLLFIIFYLFLLWCILVVSYSFNTVSNDQFIIPFISANLIRLSNSVLLFICIIVCFYLLRANSSPELIR